MTGRKGSWKKIELLLVAVFVAGTLVGRWWASTAGDSVSESTRPRAETVPWDDRRVLTLLRMHYLSSIAMHLDASRGAFPPLSEAISWAREHELCAYDFEPLGEDAWGTTWRAKSGKNEFRISSAGPDGEHLTSDDLGGPWE